MTIGANINPEHHRVGIAVYITGSLPHKFGGNPYPATATQVIVQLRDYEVGKHLAINYHQYQSS